MTRILAINGSYRDDGITDQTVVALAQAIEAPGGEVEIIRNPGGISPEQP